MAVVNDRLNALKEREGLNIVSMARKADLPVTTITNYLKSREPSCESLIKISKAFNVSVDWLLGLTSEASNTSNLDIQHVEQSLELPENSLSENNLRDYRDFHACLTRISKDIYHLLYECQSNGIPDKYFYFQILDNLNTIEKLYDTITDILFNEPENDTEKKIRELISRFKAISARLENDCNNLAIQSLELLGQDDKLSDEKRELIAWGELLFAANKQA